MHAVGDCVLLPVGVTESTVEYVLSDRLNLAVSCVVAVTVPGMEEEKERIMRGIELLANIINARLHRITVAPWNPESGRELYSIVRKESFERLVIVGTTGTRYLQPILLMVALQVWRERKGKCEVLLLQGVEGEEARLVPLLGFLAPAMRISKVQRRLLNIIYSSDRPLSGKELIEKHGFTRSVYYVLADLERKGLVIIRRGAIEKTWPGELFYRLIKEEEQAK